MDAEGALDENWFQSPLMRNEFAYLAALHEIGHHVLGLPTHDENGQVLFADEVNSPAFGSTPLVRLTRPVLKEWFAALDATPGTARKVHTVLSSILSEGVELGLMRENPAARLRLAAQPRRDMTILTAEEVRALAEGIERPPTAWRSTRRPTQA